MTIKKRIVLFNIIVLTVPILLSLIVGIIILQTVGNRYWFSLVKMYQDDNGVYSAQSLLYAYSDELSAYNWRHYDGRSSEENGRTEDHEENDSDYIRQTATMKALANEMEDMGYHFIIIAGKEIQYSNLHDIEKDIVSKYTEGDYRKIESFIIKDENASIIKATFYGNSGSYEMLAVSPNDGIKSNSQSYLQRYVITFIIAFIMSVFCLFVIVNYIVSHHLGKAILQPLKKLKEGSEEIKSGNLEFKIDYNKTDEFGDVCHAFDEMRSHLKASVDSRIKYEDYKKDMIEGVSHDLRTPLTTIKGYTEGLKDGVANSDEKQKRYYNAILTRTQDMRRLVDNLSSITQLDNSDFRYNFIDTDMKAYIENSIADYRMKVAEKELAISLQCEAQSYIVAIDQHEILRVFNNLLDNAAKHSNSDCPKVEVLLLNEDRALIIQVQDNGFGVQQDELEDIFVSFYRGDKSRTNVGKGSGLGLSIVKQIIEGHGGSIKARNNNGLCICISLPLSEEDV